MLQVSIYPYDLNWKECFEKEKAVLLFLLFPFSLEIEHIGSTSVPGLASKNVIDMLLLFDAFPLDLCLLDKKLAALGYLRKDVFSIKDYLYYTRGDRLEGIHLHITSKDHTQAQVHLAFRDILRREDSLRREYEKVKRDLATRFATDRASYRREKRFFIQKALEKYSGLDPALIEQSQNSYIK